MISPVTTTVELCNLALDLLGSKVTLASLSDGSEEAAACSRHLSLAVSACLDAVNWPFAKRYALLFASAGSGGTPTVAPEPWGCAYDLPVDCVTPRSIYPGFRSVNEASKIPFDFLTTPDPDDVSKTLQIVVTDVEGDGATCPVLEYTASVDPKVYPVPFVDLVVSSLALRLAAPLTADPQRVAYARQVYQQAMATAFASSASARQEDLEADGAFMSARR